MKQSAIRWAFAALSIYAAAPLYAAQPPLNLGQTSFLDGKAKPGFLFQQFLAFYNADQFVSVQGNHVTGDTRRLNTTVSVTHLAYISKTTLLGAYVGFETLIPVINARPSFVPRSAVNNGAGDPILTPLLQWPTQQLFGFTYWQRLGLTMHVPWGAYDRYASINPDGHAYSFNPYYAFTLEFNPKWEFSGRLMYSQPGKNNEPNPVVALQSTQFGRAYHANVSLSRAIDEHWRVGVASYFLRQITLDRRDGIEVANSCVRTNGIGLAVSYGFDKSRFFVQAYKEFSASNTSEGNRVVFRYMQVF